MEMNILTNKLSFIDKYLNINNDTSIIDLFKKLKSIECTESTKSNKSYEFNELTDNKYDTIVNNIIIYNKLFKQKIQDTNKVINYLINFLTLKITQMWEKINVQDADINYFMEQIYENNKLKFKDIVDQIDINHIIKMLDYNNKLTITTFKYLMIEYYRLFTQYIIFGKYGKKNQYIYEYIDENWSNINFKNLLVFTDVLNRLKFYGNDMSKYEQLIQSKFDDDNNIIKLLEYVKKTVIDKKDNLIINDINDINDVHANTNANTNGYNKQFNFRFILDNIKSNGFLFFEKYYNDIQFRYSQNKINIEIVNKDLSLVKYFITIISQKENTNVNRYVNEILIKIRNYIFDIQESYYNNVIYQKITLRAETDKYKNIKIDRIKRELTNFKILKYNYCSQYNHVLFGKYYTGCENVCENVCENMSKDVSEDVNDDNNQNQNQNQNLANHSIDKIYSPQLEMYFDIYKSFYKTRYPDRDVEFDLIDSTIIVKMKFNEKTYYIHMALLQYIVLDKIMGSSNTNSTNSTNSIYRAISAHDISVELSIPLNILNATFNSLLKIKIIKRSADESNVRFILNSQFEFEKNKLSISSLIKIDDTMKSKVKNHEYLHDRNMIVLCNLINYAKKNKYFSIDTIIDQLSYVIPFKLNDKYINLAIEKAVDDEYIKKIIVPNNNNDGINQYMYQYID